MIAVVGATGTIGRALVPALIAEGEQVIAVSRGVTPARLPVGAVHRRADLGDPQALAAALGGAETLFLMIAGEQLFSGVDPCLVIGAAESVGVRRVVLLSSQAVGTRPGSEHHRRMADFEDVVRESGLDWVVLRPGGFSSNALAWADSVRNERTIAAPFGDVGVRLVDPVDVAEVAARVLGEPRHRSITYVLNGPERVTPRQQAAAIGQAVGSPVRFVELTREQARADVAGLMPELRPEISPATVADSVLAMLGAPTAEELAASPDIHHVLGRRPNTFAHWAHRNAAAFV